MTRTFKVSGLLLALGIALGSVPKGFPQAVGILLAVVSGPVFTVSLLRLALRRILWSVGRRLFVSYLLVGFVPIFLVTLFLAVLGGALAGQQAGRRVESALRETANALVEAAHDFEAPEGSRPDEETISRLLAKYVAARRSILPDATWAYVPDAGKPFGPFVREAGAPSPEIRRAADEEFALVAVKKGAAAVAAQRYGAGTLYLVLPLDARFTAQVEARTGVRATVSFAERSEEGSEVRREPGGGPTVSLDDGSGKIRLRRAQEPAPAGSPEERYLVWPLFTRADVRDWTAGTVVPASHVAFVVRTGYLREVDALFGKDPFDDPAPAASTRRLAVAVLVALGGTFGVVALLAVLVAVLLVLRIARTTSRLWGGFREVAKGNFGVRLGLGGRDQLSALVDGFNAMAENIEASVAARAEAEAVEHELETARQLQRRLLPPAGYAFPGLSIAADFHPAAAIGGDFYQFLELGEGRLAAVVADVSGHGLPTGIVMASVRASLSALARSDAPPAAMFARLDEEIEKTTDTHLFVTMAHLLFDFGAGTVSFTNAGHIYPWRVEPSGRVSALENPARPLGVRLPREFRTVTAPLVPGDAWVLLSDGIVEGQSPSGDLFGFDRLETILAEGATLPAGELVERILAAWRAFTGTDTPEDDRTLLVLRVTR